MRIYLDLCCFNRPFDDQSYRVIYLETEAKLFIQDMIKQGVIEMVWSYMLEYENSANPDNDVKHSISQWRQFSDVTITQKESIITKASDLKKSGLGAKDSIHIACAIEAETDYFITADKGIIKKRHNISDIAIVNPIEFIQIMEGENEN